MKFGVKIPFRVSFVGDENVVLIFFIQFFNNFFLSFATQCTCSYRCAKFRCVRACVCLFDGAWMYLYIHKGIYMCVGAFRREDLICYLMWQRNANLNHICIMKSPVVGC